MSNLQKLKIYYAYDIMTVFIVGIDLIIYPLDRQAKENLMVVKSIGMGIDESSVRIITNAIFKGKKSDIEANLVSDNLKLSAAIVLANEIVAMDFSLSHISSLEKK